MPIEYINYSLLDEKKKLFSNFDTTTQTWLVSDLESKKLLIDKLLDRGTLIEQEAVLRMSEFWDLLAVREFSDFEVIDSKVCLGLVEDWLKQSSRSSFQKKLSSKDVVTQIEFFLPLIVDTSIRPAFEDWTNTQPIDSSHLFNLLNTATEAFAWLIEKKILISAWIPGLMLSLGRRLSKWPRDLIFDLGYSVSEVEAQWIKTLSSFDRPVKVLVPEMKNDLFRTPHPLRTDSRDGNMLLPIQLEHINTMRFRTTLEEVKWAVSQIKAWQVSAPKGESLAIVAPDLEPYLPLFQAYLDAEGLDSDYLNLALYQNFYEVQLLLTELKLKIADAEKHDLELSLFKNIFSDSTEKKTADKDVLLSRIQVSSLKQPVEYTDFSKLLSTMLTESDVQRIPKVYDQLQKQKTNQKPISFNQFLILVNNLNNLGSVAHSFLEKVSSELSPKIRLSPRGWLLVLEQYASRLRSKSGSHPQQVSFFSLESLNWLEANKVIVLGMSQNQMIKQLKEPLPRTLLEDLRSSLGVSLGSLRSLQIESLLYMRSQEVTFPAFFCFAEHDLNGTALAPALLWLISDGNAKFEAEANFQNLPKPVLDQWLFNTDLFPFKRPIDPQDHIFKWNPKGALQLSASSIERLARCQFIFAAEKILKLRDEPPLDLEMHPMRLGSLLHQILFELKSKKVETTDSRSLRDFLESLIEKIRLELKVDIGSELFFAGQKERILKILDQFFKAEAEWMRSLPGVHFEEGELDFDVSLKDLFPDIVTQREIRIRGQIDRIDRFNDVNWIVSDYKMQTHSYHHWTSWLKEDAEAQLLLYSMILEKGLTKLEARPVTAALYFDLKTGKRDKGFVLGSGEGLQKLSNRYNKIGEDQKEQLFESLSDLFIKINEVLESGRLGAQPKDTNHCHTCNWRPLCRAPHLR